MGTSQSSPGPGGGSPLVPPWADDEPQKPLPLPEPGRFRLFRQSFGRFIRSGDRGHLNSALGNYARQGTGGGSIASRRMGSVTAAGAALYEALSGETALGLPSEIAETLGEPTVKLSDLAGQSCELVIEIIIRALTPNGGEADKIRVAMNHALVEALDGIDIFDPSYMTQDVLVNTMISFLAGSVFSQIVMDAGDAWNKADPPHRATEAENELRELIKVVVDKYMAPKFAGEKASFTNREIRELQRQVIREVWNEWESFQ